MRTKPLHTEPLGTSNSVPGNAVRRSKRVIVDVPLLVRGQSEDKLPFQEETFTVTVSAHGGLVVLEKPVTLGQKVTLVNPKTSHECEATIAFLGPAYAGLATVGLQFMQPSPGFWALSSPPADWNVS